MSLSVHRASRFILATPHAIFRAFLDPESLVNWRPPAGMRAEIRGFNARPGGGYRMVLIYKAPDASAGKTAADRDIVNVRFADIEPETRIVEMVSFDSRDPAFAGTMKLTTTLRPVDDGTEVTFCAENVPPGIGEDEHRQGMESSLRNLANLLE
ncbi:MAG: SRPBCC domain-containing protein [Sphingobium sp.]|nr:SRPBCC domain-containing protein [Sphingobium sp.]